MEFLVFDTPLGQMALAEESGALTRLFLPGEGIPRLVSRETPLLSKGRDEILAYLRGERHSFDLPLDPMGTPFQQAVWAELRRIPYGETRSYAQVAARWPLPGWLPPARYTPYKPPVSPGYAPCPAR